MHYGSASVNAATGYTTSFNPPAYGGGVLIGFRMLRTVSLELGSLYLPRGYQLNSSDGTNSQLTLKSIQVSLGLRFDVLKAVYLGMGAYFSHVLGGATFLQSDGTTSEATLADARFGADDYGVMANVGIHLPLLSRVQLVLDGRAFFGLQNISKVPGSTIFLSDYMVLGGFRFGM
jgi:hypothetical protein